MEKGVDGPVLGKDESEESDSNACLLTRMSWIQHLIFKISKRLYYKLYVKVARNSLKEAFETFLDEIVELNLDDFIDLLADMYPKEFEAEARKRFEDKWNQAAIDNQEPDRDESRD